MEFGAVPLAEAEGAILAHSLALADGRMKKGRVLDAADLARLSAAGIAEVTVARLAAGDLGEDAAASAVAAALVPRDAGLSISAAFAGRVNFHAEAAGIIEIDTEAVARLNGVDPAITLATLAPFALVRPRQMVATVKIIAYGVAGPAVAAAARAGQGALRLHPVVRRSATLILTRTPGMEARLLDKGRRAIAARLEALDIALLASPVVAHETAPLARALAAAEGDMVLVLTASATSDARDVGPAGLGAAGGRLIRFGMPVDPGNLLFLGDLAGRPVLGLPGCARSPALNGADWVLERLACGVPVGAAEIAAMGVGGLLKEIPTRPEPRARLASPGRRPRIEALAADADAAAAAARAGAEAVHEVAAGPLEAMLAAGMARIGAAADAVLVAGAGAAAGDLARLIAAFSPADGREICLLPQGAAALFGRRFFEPLAALADAAALAALIAEAEDFVVELGPATAASSPRIRGSQAPDPVR